MKSFKKILTVAATSALALTLGAFTLTGCGGTDYTFEAEKAILADGAGVAEGNNIRVETGVEWTGTETEGAEVTVVSYFNTAGQTITWKINSDKKCSATLTLRASSCKFGNIDANGVYAPMFSQDLPEGYDASTAKWGIGAIPAAESGVALKVNDTEATLEGTLPATVTETDASDWGGMMSVFSIKNMGEYTAKIKLNKGENVIVLEAVEGGFNVDKLTINCGATLTWTETDN